MHSVCPACEKLNPAVNLYCQRCGASLHGARMVSEAEQEPAEAQKDDPQRQGKDWKQKAKWPLLVALLLAVCLIVIASVLLGRELLDRAPVATNTATPVGFFTATAGTGEASRVTPTPLSPAVTLPAETPRGTGAAQTADTPRPTSARTPTTAPSLAATATAVPLSSTGSPVRREGDLEPTNVRFLRDPLGALHFLGEVQNNGDLAAEQVEVSVALLDGNGEPLATEAAAIPARLIPDGDRSPFEVIIRDYPRNWASYQLEVSGVDAEPTWQDQYAELEIVEQTLDRPGFDDYRINGLVKNPGQADARGVQVIATFYGNDGRVVAVASTEVEPSPLAAGKAAPFRITVYAVPVPVVHYALNVEGTQAD